MLVTAAANTNTNPNPNHKDLTNPDTNSTYPNRPTTAAIIIFDAIELQVIFVQLKLQK